MSPNENKSRFPFFFLRRDWKKGAGMQRNPFTVDKQGDAKRGRIFSFQLREEFPFRLAEVKEMLSKGMQL